MSNFFIVAVDEAWGIAKDYKIPWHYKEDFKFFKEMTQNHQCVMGYNTYKEIAEMRGYPCKNTQLLPNRHCTIISELHEVISSDNVIQMNAWDFMCYQPMNDNWAFMGGRSIYDLAMRNPLVDYGYITRIKKDYECNIHFNHKLLEMNFKLHEVIKDTDELRFEKWIRKTNEA